MDHKIIQPVNQPRQKSTIVIFVLLGIIVLMLAFGAGYYFYQKNQMAEAEELAAEKEVTTTKVKRGNLNSTLDDISGVVRSNQSVYLYWQISGTVSDVFVEVGDDVKKGDVLAALDRSTIDASVIQAELTKETKQTELEELYTSSLELATRLKTVATTRQALNDAEKNRDALGVVREDEIEIGVYWNDYQKAIQQRDLAQEYYDSVKDRQVNDSIRDRAKRSLESAESAVDSTLAMYNWYNGETNELEVQQADAAVLLAQAQYDDAVREYDKIKNGPTESMVNSIQAEIDAAQATINTAYIIAPIDGTVAQVDAKQFDVIAYESTNTSRDALAVRVDDLSASYVDITVSELEINDISLGQEVSITFDAIPLSQYTGVITNISNAGTVSNLTVNYDLTVKMDNTDGKIKSGMMADLAIVTEQVEDVLYVPMTTLTINADGTRIVKKKLKDGTFEDVSVQVGMRSGSDIQIISDRISEGDEVQVIEISRNGNSPFNMGFNIGVGGAPGGMAGGGAGGRPNGGGRR